MAFSSMKLLRKFLHPRQWQLGARCAAIFYCCREFAEKYHDFRSDLEASADSIEIEKHLLTDRLRVV